MACRCCRRSACCCCRARLGRLRRHRRDRDGHPVPGRRERRLFLADHRGADRRLRADDRDSRWRSSASSRTSIRGTRYTLGKAYQLSHSLIAFGRGEFFGGDSAGASRSFSTCPRRTPTSCSRSSARKLGFVGVALRHLLFLWLVAPRSSASAARRSRSTASSPRCRAGHRHLDRRAGVHQHGREHGRAADQGPHAAADELRRLGDRDEPASRSRSCCASTSRTGS